MSRTCSGSGGSVTLSRRGLLTATTALWLAVAACTAAAASVRPNGAQVEDSAASVFERSGQHLRDTLARRSGSLPAGACALNGNATTGTCTSISSISQSLIFCSVVKTSVWTSTEVCVADGASGALAIDQQTQKIYNQYRAQIGSNSDCLNRYQDFLCAVAFPQCVDGTSVFVCQSTCQNYYDSCSSGTSSGGLSCQTNPPSGIAVVAGSAGPSLICTGTASPLKAPSSVLVLAATFLAAFIALLAL